LKIGELKKDVSLAVVGRHNVRNALAAAAVCWSLGVDLELICRGLESFEPVYGRMVMRRLKNEAFLVDDSYNANPSSMKEALKTLSDMKGKHRGIAVLGDMLELGAHAMELHEEIGRIAADVGLHALILKGAYSRAVAFGAMEKGFQREQILFMEKTEDMIGYLETHLQRWDWVLVKGSRGMKLDEVVTALIRQIGLYDAPFSSEGVIIGD
jgi:UDP-N-acetylmuramyl pentapeptide synthase